MLANSIQTRANEVLAPRIHWKESIGYYIEAIHPTWVEKRKHRMNLPARSEYERTYECGRIQWGGSTEESPLIHDSRVIHFELLVFIFVHAFWLYLRSFRLGKSERLKDYVWIWLQLDDSIKFIAIKWLMLLYSSPVILSNKNFLLAVIKT